MRRKVTPIHPDADALLRGSEPSGIFSLDSLPSVWTFDASTEWLVEGLIPSGGLTLITGDSGVGKSTLALALAGAVAHGQRFLDHATVEKPALYVDGENPLSVCRERLDRLGIEQTTALTVWGGWNDPSPEGPNNLSVIEWARKHRGLIVYDSLIQFHPGSEQDASETRRYLKHFRNLAHMGAALVVLANTGKGENSKHYRGSSDIKAAVDQAFCLESVGDTSEGTRTLRLTPFKCRIVPVEPLRIEFHESGFRLIEGKSKTNRETVEQVIAANPNRTGKEIVSLARAVGVAKNRAEALLMEGAREGWLIVTPGLHNSNLYRLRGPDD